jgi:hypothetical protein
VTGGFKGSTTSEGFTEGGGELEDCSMRGGLIRVGFEGFERRGFCEFVRVRFKGFPTADWFKGFEGLRFEGFHRTGLMGSLCGRVVGSFSGESKTSAVARGATCSLHVAAGVRDDKGDKRFSQDFDDNIPCTFCAINEDVALSLAVFSISACITNDDGDDVDITDDGVAFTTEGTGFLMVTVGSGDDADVLIVGVPFPAEANGILTITIGSIADVFVLNVVVAAAPDNGEDNDDGASNVSVTADAEATDDGNDDSADLFG